MKVNLEDQGRQKVSFSFAQTKKPLQSLFFISSSPEKSGAESPAAPSPSGSGKGGHNVDTKTEQKPFVPKSGANVPSQTAVSPVKLKTDLSKMHFKKHILSVSVTDEQPTSVVMESHSVNPDVQKPTNENVEKFPILKTKNAANVCPAGDAYNEASETSITSNLKKLAASSGKDEVSLSTSDPETKVQKSTTRTLSDYPPSFESDADSVQMSSSRKAGDSKSKMTSDSRSKEAKRYSSSSHAEEKEKSSSKRSETHERSSSYSKSDRDSRYTSLRSFRSDRRRSRSRSRSRSRGSRTSSTHSRLERSRGDRGSRSERSYYHDSDRRSYRSSPRRERRRSRSRTDRTRDSSDSEDDHRKTRTRTGESSRLSTYSSSHKESRSSSHVKAASKSADFSELDKTHQSSKMERSSKRQSDSDSQRRSSPDIDHHKSSSGHKSENTSKSSSLYSHHHTSEKHQKVSDSETGKSHTSDENSRLEESCKNSLKKTSKLDPNHSTSSVFSNKICTQDRQSNYILNSPQKAPSAATVESCSESEERNKQDNHNVKISLNESKIIKDSKQTDIEEINKNIIATNRSEEFHEVNATLEELTKENDCIVISYDQTNPTISTSCSSNEVMCNTEKIADCSLEPKFFLEQSQITVIEDVNNPTPDMVDTYKTLPASKQSDTNVSLRSDLSCLESENHLTCQENTDADKKSSSAIKKSRWDIIGQDASDLSHTTLCSEMKPAVKKIISVKKIEFSKDNSQDADVKENTHGEAKTHSKAMEATEERGNGSVGTPMSDNFKDQSVSTEASNSTGPCDLTGSTNKTEPLHKNEEPTKSPNSNDENTNQGAESRPVPLQLLVGQNEASDSDNSEYDSDCCEAIKRLHSVVVVPKNSSLTSDAKDTGASPCRGVNSSDRHNATGASETILSPQQTHSSVCVNEPANTSIMCQSQSNMIDSTSHSEGSHPYLIGHMTATDVGNLDLDNSSVCQKEHQQYVSSGNESIYSHYKQDHFLTTDRFTDKNGFNLRWDFTQAEQPSSTCPQPDSSAGAQLLDSKLTRPISYTEGHIQSNAPAHNQFPALLSGRMPFLQDPSEIHPDSLTNDHWDYSGAKPSNLSKTLIEISGPNIPGMAGFVQGHEISSNSRGPTTIEPPREDSFKPHRGRGPPKKRRQEVESDSDNEAEAGPAGKKDRHEENIPLKDNPVKTVVPRPSLTIQEFQDASKWRELARSKKMPPYFDLIEENLYLTERSAAIQ